MARSWREVRDWAITALRWGGDIEFSWHYLLPLLWKVGLPGGAFIVAALWGLANGAPWWAIPFISIGTALGVGIVIVVVSAGASRIGSWALWAKGTDDQPLQSGDQPAFVKFGAGAKVGKLTMERNRSYGIDEPKWVDFDKNAEVEDFAFRDNVSVAEKAADARHAQAIAGFMREARTIRKKIGASPESLDPKLDQEATEWEQKVFDWLSNQSPVDAERFRIEVPDSTQHWAPGACYEVANWLNTLDRRIASLGKIAGRS